MTALDEPPDTVREAPRTDRSVSDERALELGPMSWEEAHERIGRGLDVQGRPVDGSLVFVAEPIVALPLGLTLSGRLSIFDCASLESLPVGLTAGEGVRIRGCERLHSLPPDLALPSLEIHACRALSRLPRGLCVDVLDVGRQMAMHFGPSTHIGRDACAGPMRVLSLGEDSFIGGSVMICADAPLPRGLLVTGDLDLERSGVLVVPDDLRVEGTLTIPASVESLPRTFAGSVRILGVSHPVLEGLRVEGDLEIVGCPYLLRVADIRCGGSVRLRQLPALVHVEDVRAAGFIDVEGCDRLRDFDRVANGLRGAPAPAPAGAVGGDGASIGAGARTSLDELWRAVFDQPDDQELILVLADALLEAGDRRGELFALQCRGDARPGSDFDPTWGPDARTMCGPLEPVIDVPHMAEFRLGFLRRAWVSFESEERARAFHALPDWATAEHIAFSSPIWRIPQRARRLRSVRLLPDIGAEAARADLRFVDLGRDLNERGQSLPLLGVQAESRFPWARSLASMLKESRAIEALEIRVATSRAHPDPQTLELLRSEAADTLSEIRLATDVIRPADGLTPLVAAALAHGSLRRLTLTESPLDCVRWSASPPHAYRMESCLADPGGYQLDHERDESRPDALHAILSRTGEPRSSLETLLPLVATATRFTLRRTSAWPSTDAEVSDLERVVARHCPRLERFSVVSQPPSPHREA